MRQIILIIFITTAFGQIIENFCVQESGAGAHCRLAANLI